MSYTTVKIKGKTITYSIEKTALHIINDIELNNLLKEEFGGSLHIAKIILDDYTEEYGEFNASVGSIALEILAHVYPDRIAKRLLIFNLPESIKNQLNKILNHTDIIDVGENDIERWSLNQAGKVVDLFL